VAPRMLCPRTALGQEAPRRGTRRGNAGDAPLVSNIIVLIFAILLCLINAVVWTLISEMPFMGLAWLLAAVGCFYLQKWSRG